MLSGHPQSASPERSGAAASVSLPSSPRGSSSCRHPPPHHLRCKRWRCGGRRGSDESPEIWSFPKPPRPRNRTITPKKKSRERLLPVFHFWVCVSFPPPLTDPSRRRGEKTNQNNWGGGRKERKRSKAPRGEALRALVPRRPLPAHLRPGREVSALRAPAPLALPRNYRAFAATSSFYRFG